MDLYNLTPLYDGNNVVIHAQFALPVMGESKNILQEGFELVHKESPCCIVFLTGDMACAFQARIDFWKDAMPTAEEVESTIDAFMLLGQMPLVMH